MMVRGIFPWRWAAVGETLAAMGTLRRVPVDGRPVFLTIVTAGRRPWLSGEAAKRCVLDSLRAVRARRPFRHLAHVLLDDHLHLLLEPNEGVGLDLIVGSLKRDVTWSLPEHRCGRVPLWQPRFYDHVIRDERDLERHLDYIHFNPVKHGYCLDPAEYAWSSLRSWQQRGVYPPGWARSAPIDLDHLELE